MLFAVLTIAVVKVFSLIEGKVLFVVAIPHMVDDLVKQHKHTCTVTEDQYMLDVAVERHPPASKLNGGVLLSKL